MVEAAQAVGAARRNRPSQFCRRPAPSHPHTPPPAGLVPLEELGLSPQQREQQQHEVHSSSSSRSCSPGLGDGAHMLHDELERERGRPYPCTESEALDPRPPITYLLIYEDARVSLGIFCLPARAKIPLHNHPGMTVLSR